MTQRPTLSKAERLDAILSVMADVAQSGIEPPEADDCPTPDAGGEQA